MRVLLTGANGFIGRYLLAHLEARGHEVVPAVRDPDTLGLRAGRAAIAIDMNRDTAPEAWVPRLQGIDAVVNCAGILQGSRRQSIEAIHRHAPIALFEACERVGVKRVVQVSAVSATREAGTAYAHTKLAADENLRARRFSWLLLRPSLVVAPGAYGGTALFRALAAFPFFLPVPGRQEFQPVWIEDLAAVVARGVETDELAGRSLDPVGSEVVGFEQILVDLRGWLGLAPAPVVHLPAWIGAVVARAGDIFGGPANSTALAQMCHGNTSSYAAFAEGSGLAARGWRAMLAGHPAQWQDRAHARLYFLRPLLRFALAALWIGSAIAGQLAVNAWSGPVATALGISGAAAVALLTAACTFDFVVGLLVLARWRPGLMAHVQFAAILGYTAVSTLVVPFAWADPFGALLKNIPILAAIVVLAALERDR